MKIQIKHYLFAVIVFFILISCAKPPTIQERLDSADPAVVKAALTDMWRLGEIECATKAAGLLTVPEFREEAAIALSFMRLETVDRIVANRMNGVEDAEGHLLYFLIRYRDTGFDKKIVDHVRAMARPDSKYAIADAMYMIVSTDAGFMGSNLFYGDRSLKTAQREYILLLGLKKNTRGVLFEKLMGTGHDPLVKWAKSMDYPSYKIKYDLVDRTITENPYWEKHGNEPVMPSKPGTFKAWHTANPDILVENGMIYFYYRGGDGHDRMAVASVPYESFDGTNFVDYPNNPIIDIGKDAFDDLAVLDPAVVYFNKQVYLYYSGLGKGDDAIGLAVSKDFYNFKKQKKPVLIGRAPEIVLKDGLLYMYFVKPNEYGGYSIYLATSRDGYNYIQYGNRPVFSFGEAHEWDSRSVTVPRIREKDGVYYMFYAGDDEYMDYPAYFGVAFSYDLVNWYRGTQNPVFSRGKKGEWDDGGIWYAEVFPNKNRLFMYYEGWGGAESHEKEYGPGGHSQIGLAVSGYNLEDML